MKRLIAVFSLILLAAYSNARSLSFSGTWLYMDQVGDIVGGKELALKQTGNSVIGIWNGGISTGNGGSGKLKGYMKGNKLFLDYCSDKGNNWYKSCPKYENNGSYFTEKNNKVIECDMEDNKLYKKGNEFISAKQGI